MNKKTKLQGELNIDRIAITTNDTGDAYDLHAFRENIPLQKYHYTEEYERRIYEEVDNFFLFQEPVFLSQKENSQDPQEGNLQPPFTHALERQVRVSSKSTQTTVSDMMVPPTQLTELVDSLMHINITKKRDRFINNSC